MLRIHFTSEDLARTSVGVTLGPLAETLLSVQAAQLPGDELLLGEWRKHTRNSLSPVARSLAALFPPEIWTLDLFSLVGSAPTIEAGIEALLSAPGGDLRAEIERLPSHWQLPRWVRGLAENHADARLHLVRAVTEFHRVAVSPHWERIRQHLDAEHDVGARILRTGGVDRLLATLHPDLKWRPPVLEVPRGDYPSQDLHLQGRGLLLVPTLFRRSAPPVFPTPADGPVVLFYPATADPQDSAELWGARRPTRRALVALLGETRAAVLEVIAESAATGTEIAARLGIAPASVSEHATVLRHAGLTMRHRLGNTVLHSVTSVGVALLNGGPA
ncbi:MAG TPA: winged helix-turn-helix domain-containing protein [Amycolatopsis sp.]|nr:winged helix-turn-helix domain-containing protein [Amycolatopsis sp.]